MSGADRTARVGVKLTVDDRATAAAERIKRSFQGVKEKVSEAGHGLKHFAAQALSMTVGLEIDRGIRGLIHFGQEILHVAREAGGAQRRLGSMFAGLSGVAFPTARLAAHGVYEDIVQIGIASGVATEEVERSFEGIFALGTLAGGGIETALETTADLARISSGLGISMDQAASSVNMMTLGLVRGRDPLQRMLLATGSIVRNSKDFKTNMNEAQRAEILRPAIHELAQQMPQQLGFGGLIQSLKNMREFIMESLGVPIVRVLTGIMLKFQQYFRGHAEDIAESAEHWGESIANMILKAADITKGVFRWVSDHWDDIQRQVKNLPLLIGAGMAAKSGAEGLLGLAGPAAMGMLMRGGGAAATAAAAAPVAAGMLGPATLANVAGLAGVRAAPMLDVAAMGAATAGTGAFTAALSSLAAILLPLVAVAAAVVAGFYAVKNNLWGLGTAVTSALNTVGASLKLLWEVAQPLVQVLGALVASGFWVMLQSLEPMFRVLAIALYELLSPIRMIIAAAHGDLSTGAGRQRFVVGESEGLMGMLGIQTPLAARNAAAMERIRITNAQVMGVNALANQIAERAARAEVEAGLGRGHRGAPTIDARGSTFNLKQDFRDEDPDRIASIFTRDITRAAEARVTARTSTPFGP